MKAPSTIVVEHMNLSRAHNYMNNWNELHGTRYIANTLNNGWRTKATDTSETSVKIEIAKHSKVRGLMKSKVLKDNLQWETIGQYDAV